MDALQAQQRDVAQRSRSLHGSCEQLVRRPAALPPQRTAGGPTPCMMRARPTRPLSSLVCYARAACPSLSPLHACWCPLAAGARPCAWSWRRAPAALCRRNDGSGCHTALHALQPCWGPPWWSCGSALAARPAAARGCCGGRAPRRQSRGRSAAARATTRQHHLAQHLRAALHRLAQQGRGWRQCAQKRGCNRFS